MRINFSNDIRYNPSLNYNRYNNSKNTMRYDTRYLSLPKDTVSFKQSSGIPLSAITYLIQRKKELGESYDVLSSYDPKKLEGIQNGIEIFDGLSFQQIEYLISKLSAIAIQRGCNNGCIHCYCDAKTPFYMKSNHYTDKIDFDDYKNLLDGFKKLNQRLGFNALNKGTKTDFLTLFYDADCSIIYLEDKNGKMYDYADLAKMLYDVTGKSVLFDTAGWNLNDKKTQKRMEDLVQKVANSNDYDFIEFIVSINPFQKIYNKSVEFAEKGDIEMSKKFKEIYTDRMANVIFTFSPLIDKKNSISGSDMFGFIVRTLLYFSTELQSYSGSKFQDTLDEIVKKVEKLYSQDLISSCPKVIKDKKLKEHYLEKVREIEYSFDTKVDLVNEKILSKYKNKEEINPFEYESTLEKIFNAPWEGKNFKNSVIDVNGKFYMTNEVETYPTNITLNYKNKEKPTAPIEPNLREDTIFI